MTQENNFRMFAGGTKTLVFTVTDTNSSAADYSGNTVKWKLARTPYASPLINKTSTGSDVTTTGSTAGEFRVIINSSDFASLNGVYYHEAELESSAGEIFPVAYGHAAFNQRLGAST